MFRINITEIKSSGNFPVGCDTPLEESVVVYTQAFERLDVPALVGHINTMKPPRAPRTRKAKKAPKAPAAGAAQ
jgi:hypothetical protein